MREITTVIKIFNYEELSEKSKEKAYQEWLENFEFLSGEEIEETLKEFCKLFDVKCYWKYDGYNYNYSFDIDEDVLENEEIKGIRLAVYLWNNYAKYISEGKYYSLWSKFDKANNCVGKELKTRRSKVLTSLDDCPLTGVCYDIDILEPIINCLTYRKIYDSYEELIDDCLNSFFRMVKNELEYEQSEQSFKEEIQSNNWEFLEDGTIY